MLLINRLLIKKRIIFNINELLEGINFITMLDVVNDKIHNLHQKFLNLVALHYFLKESDPRIFIYFL